jgi:trans-2,3-dihydro-3-hydroxyanthranilate isomerase
MRYRFVTTDVFTDRPFAGNPLAVVLEAEGLTTEQMQRIAREFNLSETAFVLPPESPAKARRLRIFTPAAELPFAGHPTIGSAVVLAATGSIALAGPETHIVLEEGAGPVPVTIRIRDGRPTHAELTAPEVPRMIEMELPPAGEVAAALSLEDSDLGPGEYAIEAWSAGVPFLFVCLRDRAALAAARLRPEAWDRISARLGFDEVYLFTFDAVDPAAGLGAADVRARMFAPGLGVAEDPATGGAAAAFAGYLGVRTRLRDGAARWVVHQGIEMGRPSVLELEAVKENGDVVLSRVGGGAVLVMEGELTV